MHSPPAASLILFVLLAPAAFAAGSADADWKAWEMVHAAPFPKPSYQMTLRERVIFGEQRAQKRSVAPALAFIEKHPDDPRRWEIVLYLSPSSPRFVKQWGADDARGRPVAAVVDEAAASEWRDRVNALKTRMAAATDVPADIKSRFADQQKLRPFFDADLYDDGTSAVDFAALRALIDAEVAANSKGNLATTMLSTYMNMFDQRESDAAKVAAEWQTFAGSAHEGIRRMAEGKVSFYKLSQEPLDVVFTAVDGREVDIKKLRGKIVLLHFWATWCGPCKAELPAVQAAYAKYHDKGFEIVGISSDKDKQKLVDFIQAEHMPWPQHFEDGGGKNRFSARYGITGIPTKFLLDRQGRLVSTTAGGPRLDPEIAALLAAP